LGERSAFLLDKRETFCHNPGRVAKGAQPDTVMCSADRPWSVGADVLYD